MKKLFTLFLVVTLLFCLISCGQERAAPPISVAPSSSATQEEKTLVYWSMWSPDEPQAKVIQEAADEFEKETGIRIQTEWKGREISHEILTALESGKNIDLFDEDYMRSSKSYARYLLDLEELAAGAGYDRFAIAALPEAVRGWAGSLVTIPYQPYTSGVFYSRGAFEDAGIDGTPKNWEEFLETCQKLKEAGYTPLALDDAYVRYLLGFHLARYLTQDGVSRLMAEGCWAKSPEALRAAEELAALREKGYFASNAPTAYPMGQNEIGCGKTAMVVGASWIPGEVERATGRAVSWGMFNYPALPGGKDPVSVENVGAQSLSIPQNTQNPREAFSFILKLVSGEYDRKLSARCGGIPADTRNTGWPPLIADAKESFDSLVNIYEWNFGLDSNKGMEEALKRNTEKLFDGTLSPAQFVAQMDQDSRLAANPSSKFKTK